MGHGRGRDRTTSSSTWRWSFPCCASCLPRSTRRREGKEDRRPFRDCGRRRQRGRRPGLARRHGAAYASRHGRRGCAEHAHWLGQRRDGRERLSRRTWLGDRCATYASDTTSIRASGWGHQRRRRHASQRQGRRQRLSRNGLCRHRSLLATSDRLPRSTRT